MYPESRSASAENDDALLEASLLEELVLQTTRRAAPAEWFHAGFETLAKIISYRFAFALEFSTQGRVTLLAQTRAFPHSLHTDLEMIELPAESISSLETSSDQARLQFARAALDRLLTKFHYGALLLTPLYAGEQTLGAVALVGDAHPETRDSFLEMGARYKNFLERAGNLLGAALWRAQLGERVQELTQRYVPLVEESPDAFWEMDIHKNIVYVNEAAARLVGIARDELVGKNLDDIRFEPFPLRPTDRAALESMVATLMTEGAVSNRIVPIVTPEGRKYVSITARALRESDGQVRLQGIARDVTATKEAREQSEARTREAELLHELSNRLNKTMEPHAALDAGLDIIMQLTGADAIGIWLIDEQEGRYELAAQRNGEDILLQQYASAPFDRAVYEPGFDPDKTWNLVEYLILTRRVMTTQDFLAMPRFDTSLFRQLGYQSFLVFPMMFNEYVYGVVLLGSKTADHFDAHDTRVGSSIAAQLGLKLRALRLVAEQERAIVYADALTRIGRKIQYAPRAEQVMPLVARDIKNVLGADYVVIQLLRGDHFEVVTATDARETQREHTIAAYEREIFDSDAPLRVDDLDAPDVNAEQRRILQALQMRAALAMRLFAHDHPLGILFVNQAAARHWHPEHVEFVKRVAQQIAYALENKRLLDASAQQLRELRALGHAARLGSSALDPETALHNLAAELAEVFRVDYVGIHLRQNETLELVAENEDVGAPRIQPAAPHQHVILRELQTIYICDRENEDLPISQRECLMKYGFHADIGAPLLAGNQAIGILYLSQKKARLWTGDEIQLAETFARQVAAALEHARLWRTAQLQVKNFRTLTRTANLIAGSSAPLDVLALVADEFRRVLNVDYVGFHLLEGDVLRIVTQPQHPESDMRYPLSQYHRIMLAELQRVVINDADRELRDAEHRANLLRFGYKADIGVPMVNRNKPLGILFVSQITPRAWHDSEIHLVEAYAQQIAGVLDMAQVLNETAARVRALEALSDLYEVTTANLDREMLIELVLPSLRNLFNTDLVGVMFYEDGQFRALRSADGKTFPGSPMSMTPNIQRIFETRQSFVWDAKQPRNFSPEAQERIAFYQARAILAVPMATASGVSGLLNVGFQSEHVFTAAEKRLAQAAANQLAMAFANARLLAQQQTRLDRSLKLTEFGFFCNSTSDSVTLQTEVVKRSCDMLGLRAASIRLVQDGSLTIGASFGYRDPGARDHPIAIDAALQHLLREQLPLIRDDLTRQNNLPAHWRLRHEREGFQAMLLVPMIVAHQVTGLLTLFHSTPHAWQKLEIQYAQTIANKVALALANLQEKEKFAHKSDELQATMDSVFSGVFTADAEGLILSWNVQAEKITGYRAAEMIGKRWHVDGPRVGEAEQNDTLVLEAMADKRASFSLAPRALTCADGRVISLREVVTPLYDQNGKVRGAVCAFWDRTQEQAGERAKIDFLNEIAHQLSSKLGALIVSAQQLLYGNISDKAREGYVRVMMGTAQDLEQLHKRFGEFQRDRAQEPMAYVPVDLEVLLQKKVDALRLREPRHKFRVSGDFDTVLADQVRLDVVLDHLLDNAFRYSPPQSTIRIRAECPAPDTLALKIHNHGVPIAPEAQTHLFERHPRGSGSGLWRVRTKLYEMGGDINFSSTKREGTTFIVFLRRKLNHPL